MTITVDLGRKATKTNKQNYKKIGFNISILQQTACLVVNSMAGGNFAFLFSCTPAGQTLDSMTVLT